MESRFKEWSYIEGLVQSAYHEAALKMNLSDSEFWILYVFNFHQEGCNQSVLYKEACLTKSTVNSAIRVYKVIQIENTIYDTWTSEEQELFMKLNCDFAEKLREKINKL